MVQLWPSPDTFDHGAQPYGANVIGYLQTRLGPAFGDVPSHLHSGYGAGLAAGEAATAGWEPRFVRRQDFAGDVRVTAVVRLQAVVGSLGTGQFAAASVICRAQGGGVTNDGTADVELTRPDCYEFRIEALTATTVRFRLIRWEGASSTDLATADGSAADLNHFGNDIRLDLVAVDDGADVSLTASVANLAVGDPIATVVYEPGGTGVKRFTGTANPSGPPPSVGTVVPSPANAGGAKLGGLQVPSDGPVQVLSHTDTGGSVIQGPGRCGFGMQAETDHGDGNQTVMVCSAFEVEDLSGAEGELAWRDEWARAALPLAGEITDRLGTSGRNLACDYATDQASVESEFVLKRSTGSEAAEAVPALDNGSAVELAGESAQHYLQLDSPANVFPPPPAEAVADFTVAVWARFDTNRDGNTLYQVLGSLASSDAIEIRWREKSPSSQADIEVQLEDGDGTTEQFFTPEFAAAAYTGSPRCFVVTYKANANTATGEGRLRVYVGHFGVPTLLGEFTVPDTCRPRWNTDDPHVMGAREAPSGFLTSDWWMDGALDALSVFYAELSALEVGRVCDQYLPREELLPLGLVHGLDFEGTVNANLPGSDDTYQPWHPAGVSDTADWWKGKGTAALLSSDGLVPVQPAPLVHWHQNPADGQDQTRSVRATPGDGFSVVGLVVRGTPTADPEVWSGYRLDVGVGSPASVRLYRVLAGVATLIAEQDPGAAGVVVASSVQSTVEFTVQGTEAVPGSPPEIIAKVDSTPITFAAVEGGGASINLDDNVVDVSEERIASGPATGFLTMVFDTALLIDDWTQGEPEGAPPNPDAFPNAQLGTEYDEVIGALEDVLSPDWDIEPVHQAPRLDTEFESGHQHRLALGTYEPRRFLLRATIPPAEYAAFKAFWDEHGAVVGFTWNPGAFYDFEPPGTWHFVLDSFEWRKADRNDFVEFEVEERVAAPASS